MTDKSTHKQIINKAYKIANSISHFSQNETAKEILDIAIKSPEARDYWRERDDDVIRIKEEIKYRISLIKR